MAADSCLQQIAVVGSGAVAHAAAYTLAKSLHPAGVRVTLVLDRPDPDGLARTEISQPALHELIGIWELPEPALVAACDGFYSLGVDYQPSGREGFFLPFGRHGIGPAPASFEQGFFKRFPGAVARRFSEHFLATQAARQGRFDFPVDDPRSAKSNLRYGLHLDHDRLCQVLAREGARWGLTVRSASVERVAVASGCIDALELNDGGRLQADFYLDATGQAALLLGEGLGVAYQSWQHWLPWSAQGFLTLPPVASPEPLSRLRQTANGWERIAGLCGSLRVDALGTADTDWEAWARGHGQMAPEGVRALRPGRRAHFWQGNCLALGDAAGNATPLVLSELHWACKALLLWLELYPDRRLSPALQGEYNRRAGEMLAAIRDFHLVHRLSVSALDADERASWPESLRFRLALFEAQGRLWQEDEEAVDQDTWVILLTGLGLEPSAYDRLLDTLPAEQLPGLHGRVERALARQVAAMPSLAQVLARLPR